MAAPARTRRAPKTVGKPTVTIEVVTPVKARKWLGGNAHNRHLRESRVENYAKAMRRGEWELSPDAIAFDVEEVLLNGQHRLAAVEMSGESVPMIVLRNVPLKTQEVMDQGLSRSTADALRLRGYHNYFSLAAALGWVYRLDYMRKTGNVHYSTPGDRPTTPQLLHVLERNKGLVDAVKHSAGVRLELKLPSGQTAALYHVFSKLDAVEGPLFFDKLRSGAELKSSDPIYMLRKQMMTDARQPARMQDYRRAALICKAWNAWREGKPMQSLAWKYGPTQKEPFPFPQ